MNQNVKVIPAAEMILLPPAPDKCQDCAVKHSPEAPHDATSFYYAFKFNKENGRSPTWLDAMSHCDQETQKQWKRELNLLNIDVDGGKVRPEGKKR